MAPHVDGRSRAPSRFPAADRPARQSYAQLSGGRRPLGDRRRKPRPPCRRDEAGPASVARTSYEPAPVITRSASPRSTLAWTSTRRASSTSAWLRSVMRRPAPLPSMIAAALAASYRRRTRCSAAASSWPVTASGPGRVQILRRPAAGARGGRCARRFIGALAAIANRWHAAINAERSCSTVRGTLAGRAFGPTSLARCHAAGQTKPTPCCCSTASATTTACTRTSTASTAVPAPGRVPALRTRARFHRREFALTEQRPRMQSRAEVVPPGRGDGVVFPVHHRHGRGLPRLRRSRQPASRQ